MPSASHDTPLLALSDEPALLSMLSSLAGGPSLPRDLAVVDSTLRLSEAAEVRPDLLLARGGERILFELQTRRDDNKKLSWPRALAMLLERDAAPADLLVVTRTSHVAAWARQSIRWVAPRGTVQVVIPLVLCIDIDLAERLVGSRVPGLALLSVWAVSRRKGRRAQRVVERALALAESLPSPAGEQQTMAILAMLGDELLEKVRGRMYDLSKLRKSKRDLKREQEIRAFLDELTARARAVAEAEGRAKGEAEGRAKGEAEGKAEAVLAVLDARGLAVSEAQRRRVLACTDVETLDRWLRAAATESSTSAALGGRARR